MDSRNIAIDGMAPPEPEPPQMIDSLIKSEPGEYGIITGELKLTAAGVESLSQMVEGVSYRIRSVELNQAMGKDDSAIATILKVDGDVVTVEYMRDQPFTDDERRAALKDPNLPEGVKAAIRKALYPPQERARILKMSSPDIGTNGKPKPLMALHKFRKPDGMSGRQWRNFRKNHNRTMRGIANGTVKPN
jgi:hypothetical protein